ncbi:tetratricopeptide repeat protein [Chloroflexus sp.]|uniref:tetratricopeptide repeat protein n=1 Tax=Chloroflexus sp. TaxID=1904827 RepID=UPI002ADD5C01|nr:tetratricopeptide repeat protein [Chloroflexus sp.]
MGFQSSDLEELQPYRIARYRLGQALLRTPELPGIIAVLLWMVLGGVVLINALPAVLCSLWFLSRYLLIGQTYRMLNNGQYHPAMRLARIAKSLNPFSVDTHWLLGLIALQRNRPRVAIDHLKKACRLDPDDAKLYAALSIALIDLEEPKAAIQYARKALALNPDLFEANMVMSDFAETNEQIEYHVRLAINTARRPVERAVAYCTLANYLIEIGRRSEAESFLAQVIPLVPACPPASRGQLHYRLGELLTACGKHDMARDQFLLSIKIDPSGPCAANAWRAAALGFIEEHRSRHHQPLASHEVGGTDVIPSLDEMASKRRSRSG